MLVIFGRSSLKKFCLKAVGKLWKGHHFCWHAQWWSPWINVEKRHPRSVEFQSVTNCRGEKWFSQNGRRADYCTVNLECFVRTKFPHVGDLRPFVFSYSRWFLMQMKWSHCIRMHEIFVRKPPRTKYRKTKSIRNILDLQYMYKSQILWFLPQDLVLSFQSLVIILPRFFFFFFFNFERP